MTCEIALTLKLKMVLWKISPSEVQGGSYDAPFEVLGGSYGAPSAYGSANEERCMLYNK